MAEEALLRELVDRLKRATGANLISVVLYGSAAEGEFHPEYSDVNLLCVVRGTSFPELSKMAEVVKWWGKKKHLPPLVLSAEELKDAAAAFSIEFLDMKQRHRLLEGEDLLRSLDVPMRKHRAQLEYELEEKLLLLRQHLLLAGANEKRLWEAMLHSLSSFVTLFRHVLLELGEAHRRHSREAIEELSRRLTFDPSAFLELLDIRARRRERKELEAAHIAAGYVAGIEKVRAAIEQAASV
jgi:predicted nucleotidyltransferase